MTEIKGDELDRVLEAQLERFLAPPEVPAHFRANLQAALLRAGESGPSEARSRLERERREKLLVLEENYVRLRRRTLATMIGGAFAAGASVAVLLPWVTTFLGPFGPPIIAFTGAGLGIWIGATYREGCST